MATGYTRTPFVPDWPGRDSFPGSFMHSVAYREPSAYRGQSVLVVARTQPCDSARPGVPPIPYVPWIAI